MAFVIAEPCVDNMDQSCGIVCPVDCISADLNVDRKLYIDPDNCIDCGACEQACPNQAIFPADRLPAEWAAYAWVDATVRHEAPFDRVGWKGPPPGCRSSSAKLGAA